MYKSSFYGQRSARRALDVCKRLNETGDISELVKSVSQRISKKVILNASDTARELSKEHYSEEGINDEINKLERFYNINSKECIAEDRKLYNRSMRVVEEYYQDHLSSMTDHDRFCLKIFLASVSSQLGNNDDSIKHYQIALEILNEAVEKEEDWSKNVEWARMEQKLEKHVALSREPLLRISDQQKVSFEEALYSKTFINTPYCTVQDMKTVIDGLRKYPFSTLVLEVNALNAIYNERFGILVQEDHEEASGLFNLRNTVRVFVNKKLNGSTTMPFRRLEAALFHELTHQALQDIFFNHAMPYSVGDVEAQKEYRECIRQTLFNIVDVIFPVEKLSELEPNTAYEFGVIGSLNFPYKWSRDLTLGQLIENCFSQNGLFSSSKIMKCLTSSDQVLFNDYKIKKEKIKLDDKKLRYVANLIENLNEVVLFYDIAAFDAESITNIMEVMFVHRSDNMDVISPLMNYIKTRIEPAMGKYIENHPARARIVET